MESDMVSGSFCSWLPFTGGQCITDYRPQLDCKESHTEEETLKYTLKACQADAGHFLDLGSQVLVVVYMGDYNRNIFFLPQFL